MNGTRNSPPPDPRFESLDPAWLASKPGDKWQRHPGQLAAWVADMDFRPPACVVDALTALLERGDLGYPHWPYAHDGTPMAKVFVERMRLRYGWQPALVNCREFDDVTQAVRLVVHLMSSEGDGVVLHTPAYPPFHDTWRSMKRHLVEVAAQPADTGWAFDYDHLEERLAAEPGRARVWILCHPQNPTGHVFGRAELERIAEISLRHGLVVVSDEIHAELVYAPGQHVPFASLSPEVEQITVTLTSASKSFNIAGLRWAIASVGSPVVRTAMDALPAHLVGVRNIMGVAAAHAAWTQGGEWQAACVAQLDHQRHLLADLLAQHLPAVRYRVPAATYLAWLDCRGLAAHDSDASEADSPHDTFRRGGVELSAGHTFGDAWGRFVRLNFATSSAVLTEVVAKMGAAVGMR
jgi:cystathionine beta-lyase